MSGLKLGVNVDHIATIRELRGEKYPDLIEAVKIIESAGADGITVHLREDRRHIQDLDVYNLKRIVKGKYNLEMALSEEIIRIAKQVKPDQITLVPEKREELTTEGGLDIKKNLSHIKDVVKEFKELNIIVSLFIEPDLDAVHLSKESGSDYIEIHTGSYCNAINSGNKVLIDNELNRIFKAADYAVNIGIGVNAGHGLNYTNIQPVLKASGLEELNIGHSIVSQAIFAGISNAVKEMLLIIKEK